MKNLIYLFMLIIVLSGCNKDDSPKGNDDDGGSSGSAMLVKKITNNYPDGSGSSEEIFHYSDNKLVAIEYGCYDSVRYFKYGTSNKVSDEYKFQYENFDINTFNLQEVINSTDTSHKVYIYENDRLSSINNILSSDYTISTTFTYNQEGQLKNIVIDGYNIDNYKISYENNKISSIFHSDDSGDSDVHTFNLDNKINPFYELYNQFGIVGSDGCGDYYSYMFFADFPLFHNNIITEFVDDAPDESATYVYQDNELPEVISFDTFHGRVTYNFSY